MIKRLLLSLALIISANLWADICDGPSADKPEYKEYCKRQDKSKVDLDAACKDDINSSRCDEALDLVFGKESSNPLTGPPTRPQKSKVLHQPQRPLFPKFGNHLR